MTDKQETPSIEAAELPPRSPMEQQIRADPSRHEKILLDTIDALRAKLSAVMVRLSWKEHELNCITRDLTEAGYAPQTIKHQNRDGTPREDEMTTGAVVMFALQDLTQRATEAEAKLAAVMAKRDKVKRDYQQIVDYVMGYFPIGLCYVNPLQAIEVVIDRMKKAEQRATEAESRAARAGEDAKKWQLLQRAATRNPLPNDPAAIEEWAKRLANDVKDSND